MIKKTTLMILGTLQNSQQVESLNPLFKQAFDYIKSHNLLDAELGRIELEGDLLFINNSAVQGVKKEDQILEIHRRYIDIHVMLSGEEIFGWLPAEKLKQLKTPFKVDTDFAFYTDQPSTYLTLVPGDFVIVYPEDAHAPIIGQGLIRKLVVKIRLD